MARPTTRGEKISDARFELLLDGMRSGLSKAEACKRAGMSRHAIQKWYSRRDRNVRCKSRGAQLEKAEAEGELELLQAVRKHPTAAMTLLARKYPQRYGRQRDEPGTPGGIGNITIKQLNVMITEARDSGDPQSLITATGIGDDFDEGGTDSGVSKKLADETVEATGTDDGVST